MIEYESNLSPTEKLCPKNVGSDSFEENATSALTKKLVILGVWEILASKAIARLNSDGSRTIPPPYLSGINELSLIKSVAVAIFQTCGR